MFQVNCPVFLPCSKLHSHSMSGMKACLEGIENSLEQGLLVLNLASERVVSLGLRGVTNHDDELNSEVSGGKGVLPGI